MPTMKLNHLNVYVSDRTQLMTHKPKVVSNAALHRHVSQQSPAPSRSGMHLVH